VYLSSSIQLVCGQNQKSKILFFRVIFGTFVCGGLALAISFGVAVGLRGYGMYQKRWAIGGESS